MNAVGRSFYESLTLNSAGTFFTDRKSGGGRCAEVTVIRGSTVIRYLHNFLHIKNLRVKRFVHKSFSYSDLGLKRQNEDATDKKSEKYFEMVAPPVLLEAWSYLTLLMRFSRLVVFIYLP